MSRKATLPDRRYKNGTNFAAGALATEGSARSASITITSKVTVCTRAGAARKADGFPAAPGSGSRSDSVNFEGALQASAHRRIFTAQRLPRRQK